MSIVRTLAAGALSLAAAAGVAQATTLTTSYSAWVANAGQYSSTTTDPNYVANSIFPATTSTITLTGGNVLTTNPAVSILSVGNGDWGPWTAATGSSYQGIVYDTAGASETIDLPTGLNAFALELQPDIAGPGGVMATFTVTLSDGQSTQLPTETFYSDPIDGFTTAFVGYYGGSETSMTITEQLTNAEVGAGAPNDFAFGDFRAVPEPGTLALLASGIALLGLRRRRA